MKSKFLLICGLMGGLMSIPHLGHAAAEQCTLQNRRLFRFLTDKWENFYTVDEDRAVFRSRQLNEKELRRTIQERKLKVILNLRGENEGRDWYDVEKRVTDEMGIQLVNVALSAKRAPTPEQLHQIGQAFKNAGGPLLIHCKAGADRTGLISSLYQIEYGGLTNQQAADDMLRYKYWHVKFKFPKMREFVIDHYKKGDWNKVP